jgi:hypothetical protein
MSNNKILAINPELFTFAKNTTRKKREPGQSNRIKVKAAPKAETMKKNLMLKMIRRYQEDIHKNQMDTILPKQLTSSSSAVNTELKNAQLFFDNLAEKKNHATLPKNATLKNYDSSPRPQLNDMQLTNMSHAITAPSPTSTHINVNAPISCPKYGCLKNGSLPTFRSYMNQTRKQPSLPVNMGSMDNMSPPFIKTPPNLATSSLSGGSNSSATQTRIETINNSAIDSIRNSSYRQQIANKMNTLEQKNTEGKYRNRKRKRKKTIRRTYKIGKSKTIPQISVLISNRTIRNNITTKTQLLKQTSIADIKKYLIQHGLIRVGSITPNDVLRKIYESALTICGEVYNHNPDNILYNFMNATV